MADDDKGGKMPEDDKTKQDPSKGNDDPSNVAPPTVKVGDKEYSQEELTKVVGLGETALEYETKWNRPIGDFYPDYTQKSQKLAEFEKAQKEVKDKELAAKAQEGNLTLEEQKQFALKQARSLGIVTKDTLDEEVNKRVEQVLKGREILSETQTILSEAQEEGKPTTTPDKLLVYMNENGIKNAGAAYKLMFEKELDEWKAKKLNGAKDKKIVTQEGSTAGGKTPPPPPEITRENLGEAIRASLSKGGRG